jgi:hypothetical protein
MESIVTTMNFVDTAKKLSERSVDSAPSYAGVVQFVNTARLNFFEGFVGGGLKLRR